ncbi:MAG: response regulator [Balneolaceae bacterium]
MNHLLTIESKNILLVEDDGIQQIIMERFINKLGHTVLATVSEGEAAIRSALKIKGVDLIIMDIRLGDEIDGIEAMSRIRETSDVKVIYVTGNTEPHMRERAEKTNFEDYIEKPITIEKLEEAITNAFTSK